MTSNTKAPPPKGASLPRATNKPLPDSPGPDLPEKDPPYTIPSAQTQHQMFHARRTSEEDEELQSASTTFAHDYYPAPTLPRQAALASVANLAIPHSEAFNRLASTASISTTKASRGSPPPPETPADIVSHRADSTPSYASPVQNTEHIQPQQQLPSAHAPGAQTGQRADSGQRHQAILPSIVYSSRLVASPQALPESRLEQDIQRLRVEDPPPPAYNKIQSSNLEEEKAVAADQVQLSNLQDHPAVIHHRQDTDESQQPVFDTPTSSPTPPLTKATPPPPLPEGWISHPDPRTGQYYYIHLPTQSTQWEFPKGPTPINMPEPSSPASVYGASAYERSLASPAIMPQYATYPPSMYSSMSPMASPTAAGFMQVPPSAGLEQFNISPANSVYFGPYLRYTNMDLDNGVWYGSVMLISDMPNPPTIHLHQSSDLAPGPRQLSPSPIHQHQKWTFYRYDIDIRMDHSGGTRWTYAITSPLGCTRYEFVVAGRYDVSWRFITHSGNDFSMNVNAAERTKLGGLSTMWKDVLQKNQEVGGFHIQVGAGNQIVADRLWKDIPSLRQWTALSGKDNRKNAPWSIQTEEEIRHAYFHYYTSHFDQPHLREAFASIPHILTLDDHEIFDGFGSYPDHLQMSNMFRNIGRIGVEAYLLFQHHTTLALLRSPASFASRTTPSANFDLFTITGTGWHFLKYLGPAIVVVGPDCRSERNMHQVMAGPTYQGLFPKVALLPPCIQHVIWLLPTPMVYPRFEMAESLVGSFATGKKIATCGFNVLGKVTSSVAGIVGAKGIVSEGFNSLKKAVGKSGLMSSVLSPFGEIDIMDELRDQWTHESKDLERTYLIRTLQTISKQKSIRMTFLSGGTNCCAAGLLHDPNDSSTPSINPSIPSSMSSASSFLTHSTSTAFQPRVPSHRTMYQLVAPSIVNAPPSSTTLRLMYPSHATPRPLYIPLNGTRSSDPRGGSAVPSDTKEDMLEVFTTDVDGRPRDGRETKRLLGRRGWLACVAFDPVYIRGAFSEQAGSQYGGGGGSQAGTPRWPPGPVASVAAAQSYGGGSSSSNSNRHSWGGSSQATLTPSRAAGMSSVGAVVEGGGRISLAFDFMVQTEPGLSPMGGGGTTVKYGPIVVPSCDYGR